MIDEYAPAVTHPGVDCSPWSSRRDEFVEALARIGTGWLAACIGGGLVMVVPNWPPDTDAERLFVVAGAILLVFGVAGIIAELVAWWRKRNAPPVPSFGPETSGPGSHAVSVGNNQGTILIGPSPSPDAQTAAAVDVEDDPSRPWISPTDLHRGTYRHVSLRLTDLIPKDGTPVIAGKTFDDCTIYGPAIVLGRGISASNTIFMGQDRLESILYPLSDERLRHALVGVILLTQIRLENSKVVGVGFTGTEAEMELFRRGIPSGPDDSPRIEPERDEP
jgi:hypothetical protein